MTVNGHIIYTGKNIGEICEDAPDFISRYFEHAPLNKHRNRMNNAKHRNDRASNRSNINIIRCRISILCHFISWAYACMNDKEKKNRKFFMGNYFTDAIVDL